MWWGNSWGNWTPNTGGDLYHWPELQSGFSCLNFTENKLLRTNLCAVVSVQLLALSLYHKLLQWNFPAEFSVFKNFHQASARPPNFWRVNLPILLFNCNEQVFLLKSEENEISAQAGNLLKVSIQKYLPTFLPPSSKLLEIRASNGSADSILTRAAWKEWYNSLFQVMPWWFLIYIMSKMQYVNFLKAKKWW